MAASTIRLAGRILTGARGGAPVSVSEAWVADGRITLSPPTGPVTETVEGFVVPGLVDLHCHVGMGALGAVPLEEARSHAVADRDAGVTLIRDNGSATDTRPLQHDPGLPRLARSGRHIARSRRYLRHLAVEIEPEDLLAETVRQARAGDGWVKLVADWIDRSAGDLAPCWPTAVLKDAVAAAHDEGARVTAHVFGEAALDGLLEAGIDCVEHGTGLLERHLPVLAERDVPLVPTLVNIATFPGIAAQGEAKFPAYAAHMRDLHARRYETVLRAHGAGVRILAGTDAGSTIKHGRIGEEVLELAAAGLPAEDALGAASWHARQFLAATVRPGVFSRGSGEGRAPFDPARPNLGEGAAADFVVYDEDPLKSLDTVLRPRSVWIGGRRVGPSAML